MIYCKKCVYPQVSVNLRIDEHGICSSCRTFESFEQLDQEFWDNKEKKFKRIVEDIKLNNNSNYDCLIPVSGGKDSYFQTHIIAKMYGLKPLLMT